jgi:ubiquinone/menaquinone biosynthesis C-methylase UbiE
MARPSSVRAERYYDAHAADYDRKMTATERRFLGPQREWAVSRARGVVLELAVGTGLNLPLYGDAVSRVIGIDLSEQMLRCARARVQALGLADRVELRRGDVSRLELPDASVDTVLSTYSLCSVPDPGRVLREARRVLRPDGRLVLVEHGPSRSRVVRGLQRMLNPLTVRLVADDVLRLATQAGFAMVDAAQTGALGLVHRVAARPLDHGARRRPPDRLAAR